MWPVTRKPKPNQRRTLQEAAARAADSSSFLSLSVSLSLSLWCQSASSGAASFKPRHEALTDQGTPGQRLSRQTTSAVALFAANSAPDSRAYTPIQTHTPTHTHPHPHRETDTRSHAVQPLVPLVESSVSFLRVPCACVCLPLATSWVLSLIPVSRPLLPASGGASDWIVLFP